MQGDPLAETPQSVPAGSTGASQGLSFFHTMILCSQCTCLADEAADPAKNMAPQSKSPAWAFQPSIASKKHEKGVKGVNLF